MSTVTNLPNCPRDIPEQLIPTSWDRTQTFVVKHWRDGACRSIMEYDNLYEAMVLTRAAMRLYNQHRPGKPLVWTALGGEVKLAAGHWEEGDTVAYITQRPSDL